MIPDGALVLGLADAFDAMTCGRPYQQAKTTLEAIGEMRALAGAQFDVRLMRVLEEWALLSVGLGVPPEPPEGSDELNEAAAALSG